MSKKVIKVFILTVLFPVIAFSQPGLPGVDLGIKLGANFAKLASSSWSDGYKASFLAGAFAGVKAKKMGIQVELFYSQSDYSVSGKDFYSVYSGFYNNAQDSLKDGAFRVNYLNIPLLVQYRLVPFVWLQFGPQYSAVVSVSDLDNLVNKSIKEPKDFFKSSNFSIVLGAEVKLPVKFNFGFRYIIGLSDLNNLNIANAGAWQDKGIQLHIGYRIL